MDKRSQTIAAALGKVRRRILEAEATFGRAPGEVELLAVSKTRPPEDIRAAYRCGQQDFGENYLQDALEKIASLKDLNCRWHFIGAIQSNKTRAVANHFHWVQSLDRPKIAWRLNQQRPEHLPPLNVCIQVNISDEPGKAGVLVNPSACVGNHTDLEVNTEELHELAEEVSQLARLRLRGLMAIPEPTSDPHKQRQSFARLRRVRDALRQRGLGLDTLSMGMTNDMEAAIAEGSNMVRIGTAIFGPRT
jgi:pyridoxal phosphate enzyme (YggS family)